MRINCRKRNLACRDPELERKKEEIGHYIQSEDAGDPWDFSADEAER